MIEEKGVSLGPIPVDDEHVSFLVLNVLVDVGYLRSKVHHTNVKLNQSHASSVRHSYFFTHRVINIWNSFPNSIVVSPTVASFKRKLHSLNFMP